MENKNHYEACPHGRHIGAYCEPCAVEAGAAPGNLKIEYKYEEERPDQVNNPLHYSVGGYEAIDVIRAKLTPEEYIGGLKWQIMKYVMRANYKSHHKEDLLKAAWYAKELERFLKDLDSVTNVERGD